MASKEFEFYVKANLKEYEGKYVAIVGDKVVASGDNAKEAFEEAKRKTGKTPTIAKIPKEEALILRHEDRLTDIKVGIGDASVTFGEINCVLASIKLNPSSAQQQSGRLPGP